MSLRQNRQGMPDAADAEAAEHTMTFSVSSSMPSRGSRGCGHGGRRRGPISGPSSGDSYESLLLIETLKGLTWDGSGGRVWEVHGACL